MDFIKKIKLATQLFKLDESQAIFICFENNIPLTDENLAHVIDILKSKQKKIEIEKFKTTIK